MTETNPITEINQDTPHKKTSLKLDKHTIIILCVIGALLAFFVLWSFFVLNDYLYGFERDFYFRLNTLDNNHSRRFAWIITRGGNVLVLLGVCVFLVILRKTRYVLGIKFLAIAGVAALLNQILKVIIDRPRPTFTNAETATFSSAYPSGHSINAAVIAVVLIWFSVTHLKQKKWLALIVPVTVLVASMIALSRVFLGVHYITDIVAGITLGAIVSLGGMTFFPRWWACIGRWFGKFHKMRYIHGFFWQKEQEVDEISTPQKESN